MDKSHLPQELLTLMIKIGFYDTIVFETLVEGFDLDSNNPEFEIKYNSTYYYLICFYRPNHQMLYHFTKEIINNIDDDPIESICQTTDVNVIIDSLNKIFKYKIRKDKINVLLLQ